MSILLNGFPYWDDYNEQKGFHHILFKPGFGVQTRELNQLQTILQKQIDRFGKHIFQEGSLVLGGQFNIETNVDYLDIVGFSSPAAEERIEDLNPIGGYYKVIESTSGVQAYILHVEKSSDTAATLYIRYSTASEISDTFVDGEALSIKDSFITFSAASEDAAGKGSIFSIDEGVVFTNGYFVWFPRQLISLGKTRFPSYAVGFDIDSSIVTSNQDITLLDNAQGAYNFLAPGSDRLRVEATLTKQDLPDPTSGDPLIETTEEFVLLFIIKEGEVQQIKDRPQYSEILGEIAKRTHDESGDYLVRGLGVVVREHLDIFDKEAGTGFNQGYRLLSEGGDSTKLAIGVESGLAYVQGYEVNNLATRYMEVPKSDTFLYVNNEVVSARTGDHILIRDVVGMPALDQGTIVTLFNAKQESIIGSKTIGTAAVGSAIGTARVKEMQYESGTPGTTSARYRLYLFDIKMNSAQKFSSTRAFNVSGAFWADIAGTTASLRDSNEASLIFPIGASALKTIRDQAGDPDTIFTFRRTESIAIPTSGIFTVSVATTGESHGYGSGGTLSSAQKRTIMITVDGGVHLDTTAATITVASTTQLDINLNQSFGSQQSGTITYNVVRNTAREANKSLLSSRFVKISGPTTGPINLGFSDVLRLKRVLIDSTPITSTNQGTDITASCVLDNGQRDSFYDHARLIPPSNLTSGQHLLVELDYFNPSFSQGIGYFSVDSYPVDDTQVSSTTILTHEIPIYKSTFNGKEYDLRNHLDFRPVKANTAADAITVAAATLNPATTNNFVSVGSGGLRIPASSSQITIDYSYYLARRDVAVVDKEGNYEVIQGVPAVAPVTPAIGENVMGLARIFVPPYPSLATTYARILGKPEQGVRVEGITHARHTMREIGVLKQRIETLEYYNALSLLERSAIDMLVTDANGLDRFKNGFFVDGFMDHSLGATFHPDYNVAIDKEEQALRPFFDMNVYKYSPIGTPPLSISTKGGLTTLSFTETVLLEQMNVTTVRNIEQSVFRFVGNIYTTPDSDIWVDTQTVDAKTIDFGGDLKNTMFVNWNSWENHVLGHNVYKRTFGDRSGDVSKASFMGSFDNYAAALSVSKTADKHGRSIIETLTQDQRTGIKTTVNYQKETQELGERVIDVSIIPYIRPQVIRVYARGLKARTRYHIFFDNENMNEYLSPMDIPVGGINFATNKLAEGAIWRSDDFGELLGFLRIPAKGKKFRIGNKEIKITDSPTNAVDATSYAVGHFYAHGMVQQKQNTILSTKHPVVFQEEVVQKKRVKQTTQVMGPSCMAYSFKPEAPEGEVGVFLTSVDVWIQETHPTLGVWFEIREMDNAGNITRTQVPYSEVWYKASEITTTGQNFNINNFHTVEFPAPIFLYNDTEYAFVIHTEGLNPDTYFWISRLGETSVTTGKQINARQLTGNVYTTNNNKNWDMVPDIDLMVRFKRAKFDTGSAVIELGNAPYDYLSVNTNSTLFYDNFGEQVRGSQVLTLANITGTAIALDDVIVQGANTGTVIKIVGNKYYTTGFGFTTGAITEVQTKNTTADITVVEQGQGILYRADDIKKTIEIDQSNGLFFEGEGGRKSRVRGVDSGMTADVDSINDFPFSTIRNSPNHIVLHNTSCKFEYRSRITSNNQLSPWVLMEPEDNFSFNEERKIFSRSKEVLSYSGGRSSQLRMTLESSSEYVSPVVDLNRINALYVHNIINNDATGEAAISGGNLINRYISKTVTLADGQDAEDLLVTLTAYRPPNSDVRVWYKIRNGEDGEEFDRKPWVEMESQNPTLSSLVNQNDFKEIEFKVPAANMSVNGVQYTSGGNTFTGFKQYAVKVGLMGTNSAIVPRVGDLRAIALQL
jgi:hypothetical protein